VILLAKKYPN
jgi:UDP-glucose 4,6-dehydratase